MPEGTEVLVEHEIRIAARPETVFSYFTDPAKLVAWMGTEATLDPRPGGVCRVGFDAAAALGEFVEVDPPHRLVFTWGWEPALLQVGPQSTEVEVTLTRDGEGTVLRLVHRRLQPGAQVRFHRTGWEHHLDRLAVLAAGGDPGPDPWRSPAILLEVFRDVFAEEAE